MKHTISALLVLTGATVLAQACTKQLDPSGASGAALDVNDSGTAVGWSAASPQGHRSAVSYASNTSVAQAINAGGTIVGEIAGHAAQF